MLWVCTHIFRNTLASLLKGEFWVLRCTKYKISIHHTAGLNMHSLFCCFKTIPCFVRPCSAASYDPGPTFWPVLSVGFVSDLGARSYIFRRKNIAVTTTICSLPISVSFGHTWRVVVVMVTNGNTFSNLSAVDWRLTQCSGVFCFYGVAVRK